MEEAGGKISPAEEEQQEQQMETDDVEAGQGVSEVWRLFLVASIPETVY